jgi:L-threonylcarbamoyladenylate synthase
MKWDKEAGIIKQGGIGIIPTDTLYGIVANALNKKAVLKVQEIKGRDDDKPFIILINSIKHLELFKIKVTKDQKEILEKLWPGKVSIILPCNNKKFTYLHRGKNTLAFRIPKNEALRSFLNKSGPLIAPSANPQGLIPAKNTTEAKKYFGDQVDVYISGNKKEGKPSTVISIDEKGNIEVLREGAVKIKKV